MRTLICDLDETTRERLGLTRERFDAIVGREELEASHGCLGCFGCWTRTPARCVVRDPLAEMGPLLGATDELWVVARGSFGGYGSLVKRALDRSIGYLHPCFRVVGGEMHHRMRYPAGFSERIWLYGPTTPEERACFLRLARANQSNQASDVRGVWFCDDLGDVGVEDGEKNAWTAAPPASLAAPSATADEADPHARPARVALLNASPKGAASATQALLDDCADALLAYAGDDAPELVRASCPASGALRPAGALAGCDALVVGYPLYVDALPSNLVALLERLAAERALAPKTRVYAIGNLGFHEARQVAPSFGVLRSFCRAAGCAWCGGLAVGGGGMVGAVARTPRMGMMRRRTSEATDQLVAAVLCGSAAPQPLEARCALPRALYRLAAESMWRRAARGAKADLDAAPAWQGVAGCRDQDETCRRARR